MTDPRVQNISPNLPEGLRKNMIKFQAPSTLPVFLKGGPFDKVLFGTTCVLCVFGIIGVADFIYSKAKRPPKN